MPITGLTVSQRVTALMAPPPSEILPAFALADGPLAPHALLSGQQEEAGGEGRAGSRGRLAGRAAEGQESRQQEARGALGIAGSSGTGRFLCFQPSIRCKEVSG